MARFKPYSYDQLKLVPVSFERQILPGTFEATLSRLIDEEIDLSVFEAGTATTRWERRPTTRPSSSRSSSMPMPAA